MTRQTRVLVVDDEPFILRSLSFVLRKERYEVIEAGADDYMTKPFSPSKIVEKVREMLGPPPA